MKSCCCDPVLGHKPFFFFILLPESDKLQRDGGDQESFTPTPEKKDGEKKKNKTAQLGS